MQWAQPSLGNLQRVWIVIRTGRHVVYYNDVNYYRLKAA
jgi:hypothetical protein